MVSRRKPRNATQTFLTLHAYETTVMLARDVYEAVLENTESLEESTIIRRKRGPLLLESEPVGVTLAYLLGAIVKDERIQVSPGRHAAFVTMLAENFVPDHGVWQHIYFIGDGGETWPEPIRREIIERVDPKKLIKTNPGHLDTLLAKHPDAVTWMEIMQEVS